MTGVSSCPSESARVKPVENGRDEAEERSGDASSKGCCRNQRESCERTGTFKVDGLCGSETCCKAFTLHACRLQPVQIKTDNPLWYRGAVV